MNKIKLLSLSAIALTVFGTATPTLVATVNADSISQSKVFDENLESSFTTNWSEELSTFKSETGLSDEELKAIENVDTDKLYIKNGKLYVDGVEQKNAERGKFSAAIKLIRQGYNKLPNRVKEYIAGAIGLDRLLSLIDTYTGKVTDAICWALEYGGNMPHWMADFCAKTITAVLL